MTALRYRPPPALARQASARIDLLRLLLVAQVIFGHMALIAYPTFAQLDLSLMEDLYVAAFRLTTRFGPQAAYVFVCISGFFLSPRLLAIGLNQPDAESLLRFLTGRLKRIYPTLLAALALTLVSDLTGTYLLGAEPFYRHIVYFDATETLTPWIALGNVFSLQPTFVAAFGSNAPLWTLGYIVQFYVAAAVLTALLRWSPRIALGALAAILFMGSFAWQSEWSLLFGCWLACGMLRWVRPGAARAGAPAMFVGLCLFVLANLLPVGGSVVASGMAGALLLYSLLAQWGPSIPVDLPSPMARLNAASFPLYAFHFPLVVLLYTGLEPHVDTAALGFRIAWPVLALALALLFALPFQALLDRQARRVAA